jgi:hypothetical protein
MKNKWGVHFQNLTLGSVVALGITLPSIASASPTTLFFEDFEGYSFPPVGPSGVPAQDPGLPSIAEGAKEVWYGAHFEPGNTGIENQTAGDFRIQQPADYRPLDTVRAGFSNEAGLLFRVDTHATAAATLSFDWASWNIEPLDVFRFGYHVGSLPFGTCTGNAESGCYTSFTDVNDFWSGQFTELGSGQSAPPPPPGGPGKLESFALPSAVEVWVAFWLDNSVESSTCPFYSCGIVLLDNVRVSDAPIPTPLPGTLWLFAPALAILMTRVRRSR